MKMTSFTMENLEICFKNAKGLNQKFVAVKIEMEGFPEAEIIVNPIDNADSKLAYYKNTYDEELNHKFAKGIKIVGFTFGDDMGEIEEDLYW
jgi:wobble nucleotide-excising tRNase